MVIIEELEGSVPNTVFVGDSYVDALCAQEIGVKFIVLNTKHLDGILQRKIPFYKEVDSIREILSLFESKMLFIA